jgi:photosystem II stability/assembly factor-like uncharacterized protein/tetratricopeptide (TPR) repeat protein
LSLTRISKMCCQGRRNIWALGACLLLTGIAAAFSPAIEDATLNDVCFVDGANGWAVGDHGAIWHTTDGGQRWLPRQSGTNAPLYSIDMIDGERGWAVGGIVHPYLRHTTAVMLSTGDGGQTWTPFRHGQLPALKRVRLFDERRGWAFGDSSPLYPSGVFTTTDGGRHWGGVSGVATTDWIAGDVGDDQFAVATSRNGSVAAASPTRIEPVRDINVAHGDARGVAVSRRSDVVVVGNDGLVRISVDRGQTWHPPIRPLPIDIKNEFDFHAVDVQGPNIWIAGSPGTLIFHSPDFGRSWNVYLTGVTTPIRSITFIDERRGWAVGDLGTILATTNGGRTWQRQRSGGKRLAFLAVFGRGESVPWELLAKAGGNDGYLGRLQVIGRPEISANAKASPDDQLAAAATTVGLCGATLERGFPIRDPGLAASAKKTLIDWDDAHNQRATEILEERLARSIRTWRPDVIVTGMPSTTGEASVEALVGKLVERAVAAAADESAFGNHIDVAALQPWRVSRVLGKLEAGRVGDLNIAGSHLAPMLGCSLAERSNQARSMIQSRYQPSADSSTQGFRVLAGSAAGLDRRHDLLAGLPPARAFENRRPERTAAASDLAELRRASQKRRLIEQLLARNDNELGGGAAWLSQLGDLIGGMTPAAAGRLLFQMAQQYQNVGKTDLAAETFGTLIEKLPEHPLTTVALVQLRNRFASAEVAHLQQRTRPVVQASGNSSVAPTAPRAVRAGRQADATAAVRLAIEQYREATPVQSHNNLEQRLTRALQFDGYLRRTQPDVAADPQVALARASLYRRLGRRVEMDRTLRRLTAQNPPNSWWLCGRGELYLLTGQGTPPKTVWRSKHSPTRPHLDGVTEDETWQTAAPLQLKPTRYRSMGESARVWIAHDDEYLYLAAACEKAHEHDYPEPPATRKRDPELAEQDRVEILLDVDRDYTTYYRLTIDSRGCAADACGDDATWNPRWYIGRSQTEREWSIEAAIPLTELSTEPPASGDVWAVNVQRIVPGVGVQAASFPASVTVQPEGFGYLAFDRLRFDSDVNGRDLEDAATPRAE